MSSAEHADEPFDLIIVGAGFAGLYMLHRARGMGLRARVIEEASGVGGTWYFNRYPGARCDVESLEYCYSFDEDLQREWTWSERYSTQPEILRYLNHVADRFNLRTDITFDTRVESATFADADDIWHVRTDAGEELTTTFVVMATGCLSSANLPDITGRDDFAGEMYHTGRWPTTPVDFTGRRVGVIGTGSSGIQSIPEIARDASQLTVFMRSPQYATPARNGPMDEALVARVGEDYDSFRAANQLETGAFGSHYGGSDVSALAVTEQDFQAEMERRWERGGFEFYRAFGDTGLVADANQRVAGFVKSKIAELVEDQSLAARLTPDTMIACKRPVLDSNYFQTYNEDHVSLVDLRDAPISRITADGVVVDETVHELDVLVFATGFDAMTGALLKIDITGRNGVTLAEQWAEGPKTYLGLGVANMPNLFTITGPGSPSVLTNMVMAIEQHVDWISDCLRWMVANGHATIEAAPDAVDAWVDHVNAVADMTLYPTCNSWYLGANIPGKKRVFMPLVGYPPYKEKCEAVAAAGYEGFIVT